LHFTQGRPYPVRLGPSADGRFSTAAVARWKVASLGRIADGIEVLLTGWVDVAEFIALLPERKCVFEP
jgi:hypothetical protein